jgi:small subunit ribosomal protein S16
MVKIRLMRMGATKRPFYRVVVADSRSPRDGRFIENIGKYHPMNDPSLIEIDEERAKYWLSQGAQPTEQVANLLRITGIWERPAKATRTKGPGGTKSGSGPAASRASAESPSSPARDEAS